MHYKAIQRSPGLPFEPNCRHHSFDTHPGSHIRPTHLLQATDSRRGIWRQWQCVNWNGLVGILTSPTIMRSRAFPALLLRVLMRLTLLTWLKNVRCSPGYGCSRLRRGKLSTQQFPTYSVYRLVFPTSSSPNKCARFQNKITLYLPTNCQS